MLTVVPVKISLAGLGTYLNWSQIATRWPVRISFGR